MTMTEHGLAGRVYEIFTQADKEHAEGAHERARAGGNDRSSLEHYSCAKPQPEVDKIVGTILFVRTARFDLIGPKALARAAVFKDGRLEYRPVDANYKPVGTGFEDLQVSIGVTLFGAGVKHLDGHPMKMADGIPGVAESEYNQHYLKRAWPEYKELFGPNLDFIVGQYPHAVEEALRDPRLEKVVAKKRQELAKNQAARERPDVVAKRVAEARERSVPRLAGFLTQSRLKDAWTPEELHRFIQFISKSGRHGVDKLISHITQNKCLEHMTEQDVFAAIEQAEVRQVLES